MKFKAIIWPIVYLFLIINVCVSFVLVFRSYYYKSIFVSGSSMEPTLNGHQNGRVDYGIIDDHKSALNNLKRFQIITTYYPFSDSNDYVGGYKHEKGAENVIDVNESSYKIKRIYGFPKETIKFTIEKDEWLNIKDKYDSKEITYDESQYQLNKIIHFWVKKPGEEFIEQKIKFNRRFNINRFEEYDYKEEIELRDDEYWVMGDNYSHSSDCHSKKGPIYRDNLVGVLIAIEGTCKIDHKTDTDVDGTKGSYTCTDRKRHFPKYY